MIQQPTQPKTNWWDDPQPQAVQNKPAGAALAVKPPTDGGNWWDNDDQTLTPPSIPADGGASQVSRFAKVPPPPKVGMVDQGLGMLGAAGQFATTPLLDLKQPEPGTPEWDEANRQRAINKVEPLIPAGPYEKAITEQVLEPMTSPLGIAAAAVGGFAPKTMAGVGAGLGAQQITKAAELHSQVQKLHQEADWALAAGNIQESQAKRIQADQLQANMVVGGLMGAGMMVPAAVGLGKTAGGIIDSRFNRPAPIDPMMGDVEAGRMVQEEGARAGLTPEDIAQGKQTGPTVDDAQANYETGMRGTKRGEGFRTKSGTYRGQYARDESKTPGWDEPPKAKAQAASGEPGQTNRVPPTGTTSGNNWWDEPVEQPNPRKVTPKVNETTLVEANEYNRSKGLSEIKHEPFEVDENTSQQIADFYDKTESAPDNPEVKKAYEAFNQETHDQYEFLVSKGYKFEPQEEAVTYDSHEAMANDLANKRLKVFSGSPPEHGLLTPQQNFEFRAVHDVMGHGLPGAEFGHGGEESAYRSHLQMYSPEAQKAMATETRGQNATVHFSKELNNPPETIYSGDAGAASKFPKQKAMILPENLRSPKSVGDVPMAKREVTPNSGYTNPQVGRVTDEIMSASQNRDQVVEYPSLKNKLPPDVSLWMGPDGHIVGGAEPHITHAQMLVAAGYDHYLNPDGKIATSKLGLVRMAEVGRGDAMVIDNFGPLTPQQEKRILEWSDSRKNGGTISFDAWHPKTGEHRGAGVMDVGQYLQALHDIYHKGKKLDIVGQFYRAPVKTPIVNVKPNLPNAAPGDVQQLRAAYAKSQGVDIHGAEKPPMEIRDTKDGPVAWVDNDSARLLSENNDVGPETDFTIGLRALTEMLDKKVDEFAFKPNTKRRVLGLLDQLTKYRVKHPLQKTIQVIHRGKPLRESKLVRRHEGKHAVLLPVVQFNPSIFEDDPHIMRAAQLLVRSNPGYKDIDPNIMAHELISFIHSGEYQEIGLTDDEAVDVYTSLTKEVLELDPGFKAELFRNQAPKLKKAINERQSRFSKGPEVQGVRDGGQPGPIPRPTEGPVPEIVSPKTGLGSGELYRKRPSVDKHLTKGELDEVNTSKLYEEFEKLPKVEDVVEAAKAGAAGKYWYENSSRAIAKAVGPENAEQFAQLLAALSPRQPILQNVKGAVNAWKEWLKSDRPTDEATLRGILDSPDVRPYVAMEGRIGNAVRVLQGGPEPLSGLKVSAFTQNLLGQAERTTNDVHIARFAGVAQSVYGKVEGYYATQALIRKAAQSLDWTPMQVQAAVWVWARPFYDLAKRKNVNVKDLIRAMGPIAQKDVMDFGRIMMEDPDVRKALDEILQFQGSTLESFDREFQKNPLQYGTEESVSPKFSRAYEKRAEETVKTERQATRDLSEKKRVQKASDKGQTTLFRHGQTNFGKKLVETNAAYHSSTIRGPGFISEDGLPYQVKDSHEKAMAALGYPIDNSIKNGTYDDVFGKALKETKLIRIQVRPNSVGVQLGTKPNLKQLDTIQSITARDKYAPIKYSFSNGADKLEAGEAEDITDFMKKVNETYKLGLSPKDLRPLEAGYFTFGSKKQKALPTDPGYANILKDRLNQKKGPSFLQKIADIPLNLRRNFEDMFIDQKKALQDAQKRGLVWAGVEDPYKVSRIVYGGWGGPIESAMMKYGDVAKEAYGKGLLPQVTQNLDLNAYLNEWSNIRHKVIRLTTLINDPATHADDKARYKSERRILNRNLANNDIAPQGWTEAEITQKIQDLEATMTPTELTEVKKLSQDVYNLTRDALDGLRQDRIISQEVYNELASRPSYVSLKRILDDHGDVYTPSAFSVRKQNVIFGMKGSTRSNVDPIEASALYHAATIRLRGRNWAAKTLANFKTIDPQFPYEALGPGQKIKPGEGSVSYVEDGVTHTGRVPKIWEEAIKVSNAAEVNIIGRAALGMTRNLLQKTATGWNTAFIVKNVLRDYKDARAFGVGTTPFRPDDSVKYAKLFATTVGQLLNDTVFKDGYLNSGVAYSTFQRNFTPEEFLNPTKVLNPKNVIQEAFKDVASFNSFMEEAHKATSWQWNLAHGMDPIDAVYFAREYGGSPDFGKKGLMSSQAGLLEPFFNPAIQGAVRDVKFALGKLENPTNSIKANVSKLIWYVAGTALTTLALARYNRQYLSPDDQTPEKTHETDQERNGYSTYYLPWMFQTSKGQLKHASIRTPKTHLEQLIRNPIEAVVDKALNINNPSNIQVILSMASSVLPGQIDMKKEDVLGTLGIGLAASITPLIKEPIQQFGNKDFGLDAPIIPQGEEEVKPHLQVGPSTNKWAIELAKIAHDRGGLELSPRRLDHLISAAASGVGDQVGTMADFFLTLGKTPIGGSSPLEGTESISKIPGVGPVIKAFVGSIQDGKINRMEKEFYRELTEANVEANSFNKTLRAYTKDPKTFSTNLKELYNDPRKVALLASHSDLTNLSKVFGAIHQMSSAVANSNVLTSSQKKTTLKSLYNGYRDILTAYTKSFDMMVKGYQEDPTTRIQALTDAGGKVKDELGLSELFVPEVEDGEK